MNTKNLIRKKSQIIFFFRSYSPKSMVGHIDHIPLWGIAALHTNCYAHTRVPRVTKSDPKKTIQMPIRAQNLHLQHPAQRQIVPAKSPLTPSPQVQQLRIFSRRYLTAWALSSWRFPRENLTPSSAISKVKPHRRSAATSLR